MYILHTKMAWRDSLIISTNRGLRLREIEVLVFEGTKHYFEI